MRFMTDYYYYYYYYYYQLYKYKGVNYTTILPRPIDLNCAIKPSNKHSNWSTKFERKIGGLYL